MNNNMTLYNLFPVVLNNALPRFQAFNLFATEFVRYTSPSSTVRAVKLAGVSFYRDSLRWVRLITRLFLPSSPSAVSFAVVSGVLNTVNRSVFFAKHLYMAQVRFQHILLELLKRFPKVLYSFSSVVRVSFMRLFGASPNNLTIDVIKSVSVHSVFSSRQPHRIGSRAPARSRMTIPKVVAPYHSAFFAIATALEKASAPLGIHKTQNLQSSKLLSSQVYYFAHKSILSKWLGFVNVNGGDKDPQGVKWMEIDVKPEMKKMPIEAFGAAAGLPLLGQDKEKRLPNKPPRLSEVKR